MKEHYVFFGSLLLWVVVISVLIAVKLANPPTYSNWVVTDISNGEYPATGKTHPQSQMGTWIRETNNRTGEHRDFFRNPFEAREYHVGQIVNYGGMRDPSECVEGHTWAFVLGWGLLFTITIWSVAGRLVDHSW